MEHTIDDFLGGMIKLRQPVDGYRATSDAVTLASAVDEIKKDDKVLDVGCGTGAVSLCLGARFANTEIFGIELQNENVELANENSKLNNFEKNIKFFQGNVFEKNIFSDKNFDIVISNPPFMDKSDYASPDDSRDKTRREANYKGWIDFCVRRVKDYGKIFLIIKPDKLDETLQVFEKKIGAIKIFPIYSKQNQSAKKIVIYGVKSSRAKLEILPAIVLHNDDGSTNENAKKIQKDAVSLAEIVTPRL